MENNLSISLVKNNFFFFLIFLLANFALIMYFS